MIVAIRPRKNYFDFHSSGVSQLQTPTAKNGVLASVNQTSEAKPNDKNAAILRGTDPTNAWWRGSGAESTSETWKFDTWEPNRGLTVGA